MDDVPAVVATGHALAGTAGTVPAGAEDPSLVAEVARLQAELGVLIRYVAGRTDEAMLSVRPAPGPGAAGGGGAGGGRADVGATSQIQDGSGFPAGLLVLAPEAIARDGALLQRLYDALDSLGRCAAPADVASIQLTRAFVEGRSDADAPTPARVAARRLRRWAWASAGLGLLVFFAVVALLVHVDQGRRVAQQLRHVREEYQAVMQQFAVARAAAAAGTPEAAGPAACPGGTGEAGAGPPPGPHAGVPERASCDELRDVLLRMDVVYRELLVWNTISERLSYASPITWLAPTPLPVTGVTERQWRSTELRTSVMITSLTGFVLPMLLGLLGACVYVYREIDGQIEASTLRAREAVHGTLRILLGAILGGLLGAIWTTGQPVQLEGVTLSLGALAFFVGFSVEVVFRLVDTLVRAVANRIGKPAA